MQLGRSEPVTAFPTSEAIHARDPRDLTRLLWFLAVAALGVLAARGADRTTAGFEGDLVEFVGHLPGAVLGFIIVAVQVMYTLLFLGIPLVLLATRRFRRWGIYTLGWLLTTALVMASERLVDGKDVPQLPDSGLSTEQYGAWPPSQAVATAVTALVLLSPHLPLAWRRFGWGFVAGVAVLRVVTARDVVLDILLAIGIGGVVGYALLLAFGRKVNLPTTTAVLGALDRIGLSPLTVRRADSASIGSLPFVATMPDGPPLHCKVVAAGQYEADSLLRNYRRVRMRDIGEDVAYSSVRRAVAVEAMLSMSAERAGARTPTCVAVAPIGTGDDMLLAFPEIQGTTLDEVPAERLTGEVLDQAWTTIASLRTAGVAHRDLQLSSWLLDDSDQLWLIDFSFGEPGASDGALGADIAELLAATYSVVGAQRAVAPAARVLGTSALETGLSYLVPVALTRPTRAAVKSQPDGLEPLVAATAEACGVEEPQFAPIERVKPRSLVMAGLLVVAVYVLIPQLTDVPRMLQSVREADPAFVLAAAGASLATYLGSGMALVGSMPIRIPYVRSVLAAISATFVGAVAPPGVAHVGLNVRFGQKQGLPAPVAVSATATKEVGVGVVHVTLLLLMAVLAGSTGALQDELDKLPSIQTIAIGVAILLAVVGVAAAFGRVRAFVVETVVPAVGHSVAALRELVSSPLKMTLLFVGALLLQVGYIAALYFSVRALGGDVGFTTIGLIYLTVGSMASVAPTPGGVGAVEAVLLAALAGVGVVAATALAAVFLYRLVTFWLPIPLGALAMRWLVAHDQL